MFKHASERTRQAGIHTLQLKEVIIMKKSWAKADKGFTMIELLMVVGMLSVLMTAIYSLYRTQQRSAYVQDDVVEVQQNMRIALDNITKDMRMAALFLVRDNYSNLPINIALNDTGPGRSLDGVTGLPVAAATDSLTLNSLSSSVTLAMAWMDLRNAATKDEQRGVALPFVVDSADAVDRFIAGATNGDLVKIVRPEYLADTIAQSQTYRVTAKDRAVPSLTLTQLPGAAGGPSAANHDFFTGDVIIKVPANVPVATNICTIRYFLTDHAGLASCPAGQLCLARTENGDASTTAVVATNITDLQFAYIKRGTTHLEGSDDYLPTGLTPDDEVRAVKVIITGLTNASVRMSDNKIKMRTLQSVVRFNNKK